MMDEKQLSEMNEVINELEVKLHETREKLVMARLAVLRLQAEEAQLEESLMIVRNKHTSTARKLLGMADTIRPGKP